MVESANYDSWLIDHIFVYYPVQEILRSFLQTFLQFPPQQSDTIIGDYRALIELLEQLPH